MAEDVQPDAGPGAEAQAGIFDSYLQSVPEEHREPVSQYLKDAGRQVDGRLQEAANLRKTYEPFEQFGLTQMDPQQVGQLLQWYQHISQSDDAYREWLGTAAQEAGLTLAEQQAVEEAAVEDDLSPEQVQKLVDQLAQERMAPLAQRLDQMELERAADAENDLIVKAIADIERDEGVKLSQDQRAAILDLGMMAMPEDEQSLLNGHNWVKAGFDRYRELYTSAQRAFVNDKLNAPETPVQSGGVPRHEVATDWKTVGQQALERLKAGRA